jgi:phosphohistidine phosphatase
MLFRHGKSDWDASYDTDHGRPLSKRGRRAAAVMGTALRRMGEVPEILVSSTAERAESTAELARVSGGWSCPLTLAPDLYGAGPEGALHIAARHGGDAERLMLVGHEPAWSSLAGRLTGGRITVKTGTVLGIDLSIDTWDEAPDATGVLAFAIHPRMFTDGDWNL